MRQKKKKKKRSATSIEGEEANMNERTKVNATVLGTVHSVITPVVGSKGMTLARDRQQESRRAIKTVVNMAREEGRSRGSG